jgi:hypothetical protein
MKRRLLPICGIAICLIMFVGNPIYACYQDVVFTADCTGFTIEGYWTAYWPNHFENTISYSISINGIEVTSGTHYPEWVADAPNYSPQHFIISGLWTELPFGDIVVDGSIDIIATNGNSIDYLPIGPISLNCPLLESEGCTPGYWKNHEEAWDTYNPEDSFNTALDVNLFDPDITLMEALKARGGHENRLARHAAAALLNAAHPDLADGFPFTIEQVQDLVAEGDTDILEEANELGCPL